MGHSKIYNSDSEYVIANVMDDVENVNVREYLIDFHAKSIYPAIEAMVLKEQNLDTICKDPIAIMLASKKIAEKEIARATSLEIPENIKLLFQEELSKKEQISLLRGISIKPEQLATIFLYANDKGYKFSNYRFEDTPKKYIGADLPSFIYLCDENTIEHYGETSLTDGQMKEIITVSQFVLARILNNGKHWHCFYQTRRGLLGNEPGEYGNKSHIHYISDSFSISLKDVIKGFKAGICPHSKVHITLDESKE